MKRLTLIMATVAASVLSVFSLSASERCLCDMSVVYQDDYYSFTMVEEKPTFNGDSAVTFTQWIMENLKKPDGVSGMMVVEFIIGTDGKLSDIKVLKKYGPKGISCVMQKLYFRAVFYCIALFTRAIREAYSALSASLSRL